MQQEVIMASALAEAVALGLAGSATLAAAVDLRLRAQRQRVASYRQLELRFPLDVDGRVLPSLLASLVPPRRSWAGLGGVDVVILDVMATRAGIRP